MAKEHTPDIRTAVEELVELIEIEREKVYANTTTVKACRRVLKALIGADQLPKAKAWLAKHGGDSVAPAVPLNR